MSSDPIVYKITKARVRMLFKQPFYGNLATRMRVVDASKWCKTAATDGRHLYFNREFIKGLTDDELVFLLCHEVGHVIYDHLGRRGSKDASIWNMANDYIVNYSLVRDHIGKMPRGGLYDAKYTDEMTSEEVYRLLLDNSVKIQMTLDEHLDMGKGESDQPKTVTVTVMGSGDGPPQITEEDMEQIRAEIRSAVISAAQSVGAGNVPAAIRRVIEEFTNPVMPWQEIIEAQFKSTIKDDFTFLNPSKRSWSTRGRFRPILPGSNIKDAVKIAACIDTSGSITDEMLRDFLSEIRGIMQTFEEFELWLWHFDTKVYNPKKFTPENITDLIDYEIVGRGGTDFECNWDFMKDPKSAGFDDLEVDSIEPSKFVMFTDGEPWGSWGDETYCDSIFLIHSNPAKTAPFGMTVHYTEKN